MQIQHRDMDLENPGQDVEWRTRCRYCGAEPRSGLASTFALAGVLAVAGVLVWWLVSPVLGGLLIIGAMMGLGWAGTIAALGRIGSVFRYRG
jgi:hypothetical protein